MLQIWFLLSEAQRVAALTDEPVQIILYVLAEAQDLGFSGTAAFWQCETYAAQEVYQVLMAGTTVIEAVAIDKVALTTALDLFSGEVVEKDEIGAGVIGKTQ